MHKGELGISSPSMKERLQLIQPNPGVSPFINCPLHEYPTRRTAGLASVYPG
jgi:hypothetical protein